MIETLSGKELSVDMMMVYGFKEEHLDKIIPEKLSCQLGK
jgi:hypothetical protein